MNVDNGMLRLLIDGDRNQKIGLLNFLIDNLPDGEDIDPGIIIDALEREKSRALKERIFSVLERIIPEAGFDLIEIMLRSQDAYTRNAAVEIIKKSRKPVFSYIKWLARDKDKDVRKFAIDAISRDQSPDAMAIIRERLNDGEINIVITAVEYLGTVEDRESAPDIEAILLETQNQFLKCTCLEALAKIGFSPHSREVIKGFSQDDEPFQQFSFLRYLAEFGDKSDLSIIENIMTKYPGMFTKESVDAVEKIILHHKLETIPEGILNNLKKVMDTTGNSNEKYEIMKLLSRFGNGDLLRDIRGMLKSDDDMVKLSAVEILAECGDESDIEVLDEMSDETGDDGLLEAIGDAVYRIYQRVEST